MKKIELKEINGKLITILDLPEGPHETKFRQLVNFTKSLAKVNEEKADKGPIEYLLSLIDVLAEFFEEDKSAFRNIDLEPLTNDQVIDTELNIVQMINYCMAVCKYDPVLRDETNHEFTYKGELFVLPFYRASAYVKGITKRPDMIVGEVVESLELERIKGVLMQDDPDGSEWFTKAIAQVAILCRKPGEEFPKEPASAKAFIQERMEFFQDITIPIALDVAFFLKSILKILNKKRRSRISSTRHRQYRTAVPRAKP